MKVQSCGTCGVELTEIKTEEDPDASESAPNASGWCQGCGVYRPVWLDEEET